MHVLVLGWPSFLHGEATAGDVAAMYRVADELTARGISCDLGWSPRFRPGELTIEQARPENYTDLVFVCGPASGWQLRELHRRYSDTRRIAIGVSIVDYNDPAFLGFHEVYPRDGSDRAPTLDLAAHARTSDRPVAGVLFSPGQPEYSHRRRHDNIHKTIQHWISKVDCAPLALDTRLDTQDWRLCSRHDQFAALISRLDVVVSTRLHGLVFALSAGVPVLAIDPVAGGGKVSDQASAWRWPAIVGCAELLGAERDSRRCLDEWWSWCLSSEAGALARTRASWDPGSTALAKLAERLQTPAVT